MQTKRKRCKVIMLPTEECKKGMIVKSKQSELQVSLYDNSNDYWKPQHLYVCSDDEIKEGDWIIDTIINHGYPIQHNSKHKGGLAGCKKIIATTDPELKLPQPSKAFIEKYCELGGMDEVDVEYIRMTPEKWKMNLEDGTNFTEKPEVNSHNEITIHSIKDSWSKEEVKKEIIRAVSAFRTSVRGGDNSFRIADWIEENL